MGTIGLFGNLVDASLAGIIATTFTALSRTDYFNVYSYYVFNYK